MKLAFIAPIRSLNEISLLGDIDFCLAPFCHDKEYKKYFDKSKRYVIMDDSIAENGGTMNTDKLVKLAIEMDVDELIIPDVIGDYKKTKKKRELFLKKYYKKLKKCNIKLQSVVQGKSISEYIECLKEIERDKRIDIIGIPFRMNFINIPISKFKDEKHMYNRLVFYSLMGQTIKPVHFLGCNAPLEMFYANKFNIRSMDSKLICRYGYNNKIFSNNDKSKPVKKLYIESILTDEQEKLVKKNIKKLRRWLR